MCYLSAARLVEVVKEYLYALLSLGMLVTDLDSLLAVGYLAIISTSDFARVLLTIYNTDFSDLLSC